MKTHYQFLYAVLCLFALATWSCNNEGNEGNEGNKEQFAMVWVSHYNTARLPPSYERVYAPSVYVSAQITGNPVPLVENVQVADKVFSDPLYFIQDLPYVYFSSDIQVFQDSIPEPKFSPLSISIKSNTGSLSGSIFVPDTIRSLSVNVPDTIPLNSSFTISWTGSNADFYLLEYYHAWAIEGGWLMYYETALTDSSSIVFDSSLTAVDGLIYNIEVTPVNGTYPKEGALPNMSGAGYGFLYLQNTGLRTEREIVFGNGIDMSGYGEISAEELPYRDPSKTMFEILTGKGNKPESFQVR